MMDEAPHINSKEKKLTARTEDFTEKLGGMAEKLQKAMEEL